MIRSDVGDDGNVRLEIVYVVQLETAEFQDIDVVLLGCHLVGVALADVAAKSDVKTGLLEQMIYQ